MPCGNCSNTSIRQHIARQHVNQVVLLTCRKEDLLFYCSFKAAGVKHSCACVKHIVAAVFLGFTSKHLLYVHA